MTRICNKGRCKIFLMAFMDFDNVVGECGEILFGGYFLLPLLFSAAGSFWLLAAMLQQCRAGIIKAGEGNLNSHFV